MLAISFILYFPDERKKEEQKKEKEKHKAAPTLPVFSALLGLTSSLIVSLVHNDLDNKVFLDLSVLKACLICE